LSAAPDALERLLAVMNRDALAQKVWGVERPEEFFYGIFRARG
jgi:hypothetical protein